MWLIIVVGIIIGIHKIMTKEACKQNGHVWVKRRHHKVCATCGMKYDNFVRDKLKQKTS